MRSLNLAANQIIEVTVGDSESSTLGYISSLSFDTSLQFNYLLSEHTGSKLDQFEIPDFKFTNPIQLSYQILNTIHAKYASVRPSNMNLWLTTGVGSWFMQQTMNQIDEDLFEILETTPLWNEEVDTVFNLESRPNSESFFQPFKIVWVDAFGNRHTEVLFPSEILPIDFILHRCDPDKRDLLKYYYDKASNDLSSQVECLRTMYDPKIHLITGTRYSVKSILHGSFNSANTLIDLIINRKNSKLIDMHIKAGSNLPVDTNEEFCDADIVTLMGMNDG